MLGELIAITVLWAVLGGFIAMINHYNRENKKEE